ncbi:MAG TPA: NAD(P)-dependent oxidoreductase [Chloroflexota bacterium]|nr:NAD(P)-dependent oxidoreductase [Chloroflexota bacterium]
MGRVGFVGMGNMGSRMAARLVQAGHEVAVYNRTRERAVPLAAIGARIAGSPAEACAEADIAFTNVADGTALKAVCLGSSGVLSAGPAPKILVDMSTVGPVESAEVAAVADPLGVAYLRSPVSGSTVLAEAGKLTIFASGNKEAYDAAEPYLAAIGETRFYVGPGDNARYLKLVINMMVATQVEILSEAVVLGEKAGLDWAEMIEVISNSVVASPLVKYKAAPLRARNFAPAFALGLMIKDLDLAIAAAQKKGVELPVTERVREFYSQAAEAGLADKDFLAATLLLEKRAAIAPTA